MAEAISNEANQGSQKSTYQDLNPSDQYQHRKAVFTVDGIDCSDCALVIEHRLSRLPGVFHVDVDFGRQQVQVEYDARKLSETELIRRIAQMGYVPVENGLKGWVSENRNLMISVLTGVLLLFTWLGEKYAGIPAWISIPLYTIIYIFAGYPIARHAISALRRRHFDTDLLMLLAAAGAAFLGDFAEGGLLLFLFSFGHTLEDRVLDRARKAVRALGELMPRVAMVKKNDGQVLLATDQVGLGDIVIVRPGERIPMDGIVTSGVSSVNQAPITGEAFPVDKSQGSKVFAGSINVEGVLEYQVDRLARDSTLARVMTLVEQAQAQKSPTQRLVERFSRIYVPLVILSVVLLLTIPPFWGEAFHISFRRSIVFLVAVSPCALAIGAPATVLAGVAQAARNGVLVKGGLHLENLGLLDTIVFDKTGTLTQGTPKVTRIIPGMGWNEYEVLRLAAGLEKNSLHLLAKAVIVEAEHRDLSIPDAELIQMLPGLGTKGVLNGELILLGNERFLESAGIQLEPLWLTHKSQAEGQGESFFWIVSRNMVAGMITLSDTLRAESKEVLADLRDLGVQEILILSGDSYQATQKIALQVGVNDFRAELMPEEKLEILRSARQRDRKVGMVGDGINDAPALAAADVGIAMGGAGTDVALEAADVALMASSLEKLPYAVSLGKATRRIIIQNLVLAISVIVLLGGTALGGWAGIGPVVLLHEGSTLLVVLNALRLLRFSPNVATR